ncbi:hypothetical protein GCM10011512_00470 [Tersicoccus solisilvae]|uniref:CopC domain-containing protein n=1 Tax=Tersicoccus solisilvae TaxID=1882339 RepID=A0ABQ1NI13_9MICC|nr:copper resistance CopC family protein [Tersicoccus solisilvae]GGC77824.1 hypothetical protein GCM10011512_00470 [Tersicoccus solisilvae]
MSRRRAVALALVLTLAGLGLGAPAAQAHDQLTGTTPGDGATVSTVPETITLRFNETPIALGAQVKVLDPAGDDQADGSVRITDTTAAQAIKPGAPAGRYTVDWRIVSSDSHPIEGTFTFTATAASSAGPTTSAAGASSAATPSSTGSSAPAPAGTSDSNPLPVVVIVVGVLLLAGFGWWMVLSGRRRGQD